MNVAFPRIKYRWCRTIWTKSERCKLLTSFGKKRPVILTWDQRRWAYISNPVSTPCGRHSAQLLVDGELYPCEDFTISAGMFEVNIYSKDTSSDEEKQLIASVPSKKIEFILKAAEEDVVTSSDNQYISKSRSEVGVHDSKNVTFVSSQDSGIHCSTSASTIVHDGRGHEMHTKPELVPEALSKDYKVSSTSEEEHVDTNGAEEYQKSPEIHYDAAPTIIRTHMPLIFTPTDHTPPFYFFGENNFPMMQTLSPFTWSKEKITEIVAEDSDDSESKVSSPRKYLKKYVEVESQPEKTLTSIEKSIEISSNQVSFGSGTEKLVELEVTGHQFTTNVTSVHLIDEGAQTMVQDIDVKNVSETAVQTTNSLAEPLIEMADSTNTEDEGEDDIEDDEEEEEEEEEDNWMDGNDNLNDETLPGPFDPQLVCDKLNEIIVFENIDSTKDDPRLPREHDSYSLTSNDEKVIDYLDERDNFQEAKDVMTRLERTHLENIANEQKEYEIEEIEVPSGALEEAQTQPMKIEEPPMQEKELREENDFTSMHHLVSVPTEPPIEDEEESLESIKIRVTEREKQVRLLQQEIMLLEDSHRHLYKERDNLLKDARYSGKADLAGDEGKTSLANEVAMLRSHVKDQEKTNADLEWEVQALRTRLDSNDPTEVSQLIQEMRSLREELTTLTKRNRDLYNEIVNLREENVQLKCQSLDAIQVEPSKENHFVDEIDEQQADHQNQSDLHLSRRVPYKARARGMKSQRKRLTTRVPESDSTSNSDETEYQDFPKEDSRLGLLNTSTPRTLSVSQKLHILDAYSPKCVSAEDLAEDTRSLGIQTLITALEEDGKPQFTSTPAKLEPTYVKKSNGLDRPSRRKSQMSINRRKKSPPSDYMRRNDSDSSTDSLLDEADLLIRETMTNLLDGVQGASRSSRTRGPTKKSSKNNTQLADSNYSVSKPHGGSGDHIRTVSYHANPFIPKMDTDLHEGYMVKFFHPKGGITEGVVRYVGPLHGSVSGSHVGIELFKPTGDSNGVLNEKQFFKCETNKGVFVPLRKVVLAWR